MSRQLTRKQLGRRSMTIPANSKGIRGRHAIPPLPADPAPDIERPRTRGDCENGPRPCPWVSCRHHLYLDVTETGGLKLNFPDRDPDELAETCALDVADQNGATLEQIGEYMNFTRERSRQLEALVQIKLRRIAHGPSSPTQKLLRELSDGMKRRDD